jgi:hypothetical protein
LLPRRPNPTQLSLLHAINMALMAGGMQALPAYMLSVRPDLDAEDGTLPDDPRDWLDQAKIAPLPEELDDLAVRAEVIGIIKRAGQAVAAAHLSPTDVAALLDHAGAPSPACRSALVRLAADCLRVAMDHQYELGCAAPFDLELRKKSWGKAREAKSSLAQILPGIVGELEYFDFPDYRKRANQVRKMIRDLARLDLHEPSFLKPSSWREGAVQLQKSYTENVNAQAGWRRDGPATGFLLAVIQRVYPGCNATKPAIELLFYRRRSQPNPD